MSANFERPWVQTNLDSKRVVQEGRPYVQSVVELLFFDLHRQFRFEPHPSFGYLVQKLVVKFDIVVRLMKFDSIKSAERVVRALESSLVAPESENYRILDHDVVLKLIEKYVESRDSQTEEEPVRCSEAEAGDSE